mmetsp:Transcript_10768/g.31886  ORF Transcript_10768/g.31886 Transcript_10768/m.31886 type:complete len:213 (-) Transcript_10768:467-1105(-)
MPLPAMRFSATHSGCKAGSFCKVSCAKANASPSRRTASNTKSRSCLTCSSNASKMAKPYSRTDSSTNSGSARSSLEVQYNAVRSSDSLNGCELARKFSQILCRWPASAVRKARPCWRSASRTIARSSLRAQAAWRKASPFCCTASRTNARSALRALAAWSKPFPFCFTAASTTARSAWSSVAAAHKTSPQVLTASETIWRSARSAAAACCKA